MYDYPSFQFEVALRLIAETHERKIPVFHRTDAGGIV